MASLTMDRLTSLSSGMSVCIWRAGACCHSLIHIDILSEAEVRETSLIESTLDDAPSNTEANEDVDDADHTASRGASDKNNNSKDGSDESSDKVNANEDVSDGIDGRHDVAQSSRRSTRVTSLPYYGM